MKLNKDNINTNLVKESFTTVKKQYLTYQKI